MLPSPPCQVVFSRTQRRTNMYTDYQTETYFLQDSREMQPSI